MKFSIRGLFAFEFTLSVPAFWKRRPVEAAADYKLERFFIAGFQYHDGPDLVRHLEPGMALVLIHELDNPHDPVPLRCAWRLSSGLRPSPAQSHDCRSSRSGRVALRPDHSGRRRCRAWNAVEVAVFVSAGPAVSTSKKGKEPLLAEL